MPDNADNYFESIPDDELREMRDAEEYEAQLAMEQEELCGAETKK